jgi:opacity protein-like surface antigen
MKKKMIILLLLLFVLIAGTVSFAPVADAQSYTAVRPGGRGGNWEIFLPLTYSDSATVKGEGGSKVDINSDWGFGFGAGYNVSDNFQINGTLTFSTKSYNAHAVNSDGSQGRQYSNYMNTSTLSLNGVYYVMQGNITPFVSAGVGITYVDTNIPTGSGSTSCWYDPWYGYICSTYVPTKTENDIMYNAGIGVRFDVKRDFGLQFGYYKTWIDISKASGTPEFDIWRLDFIFRM